MRMTLQTQMVLRALLRNPSREMYGRELSQETGLMPGTVHPILFRLENEGWVASRQEEVDPHIAGRPARRYYNLTADGAQRASRALASARRPRLGLLDDLASEGGTP